MTDVFLGLFDTDLTSPVVTNILPTPGSINVPTASSIQFDVTDPDENGIDLLNTIVRINGDVAWNGTAFINNFTGSTTLISGGYHFSIVKTGDLPGLTLITVSVDTQDLVIPPNQLVDYNWSFNTAAIPVFHARPYLTDENPNDTAINVPLNSDIVFTVKTDDTFTPATAILQNETVYLNGQLLLSNGTNVLPGQYTITRTPSLRFTVISIHPILPLQADTVYRIEGTFEDDANNIGSDSFEFSTGSATFAIQLARQEPLLCPIDNIPVPLLTTNPDVQTARYSDTITSFTTDWNGFGVMAYDSIEIKDGLDKGHWLVRSPSITTNRIFHVFDETSTNKTVSVFRRAEFADRNPVSLIFSPLFDYKFEKIYGDTRLRYLAGYPSDTRFPVGFHGVPIAETHDSNNSLNGHVNDATDGFTTFAGTGSYVADLPVNSTIRFGQDLEVYTVVSRTPSTFTIDAAKPFKFRRRLSGTISVVNGSPNITGTDTFFLAETAVGMGIRFSSDPSTIYRISAPLSQQDQILLTAPYTGPTESLVTADIVSLLNVPIHRLDTTNGAVFDDQTNKRLDFDLVCNPPVTTSKWDRYSLTLKAKVTPILTETVTVTSSSMTVTVPGQQYRAELHVGAVITFGSGTAEYTVTAIDETLQEFSITPAWDGATASGQVVHRKLVGTRVMTVFNVSTMQPQTDLFIGMSNSQQSPLLDNNDRMGCSFFRRGDDRIEMRAHFGTSFTSKVTDLDVAAFIGKDWILETELIDNQTVLVSFYDFEELSAPNANRVLTVQNAALPVSSPTLDRWTITTLSLGAPALNHQVIGHVKYVDVEPGRTAPFTLGTNFVTVGTAKPRLARNVYDIPFEGENGYKTLSVQAGIVNTNLTSAQFDRIFWDIDDVIVVIDSLDVEGGASQQLTSPARTVKKFSFQRGFDEISLTFRASRRGYWYVIVDGDNPREDLVVARGVYDVADATQNVVLDGVMFSGLSDGPHTLNVVLCKEPVPFSWVVLPGTATIIANGNLLKQSGVAMYGFATLSAQAVVIPAAEEDMMVIENLTAQVSGGGGTTTLFTTSQPYRTGKIKLILDGVIQNYLPIPLRVVETNNTLGQVSLSSPPNVNQTLVAEYVPL